MQTIFSPELVYTDKYIQFLLGKRRRRPSIPTHLKDRPDVVLAIQTQCKLMCGNNS